MVADCFGHASSRFDFLGTRAFRAGLGARSRQHALFPAARFSVDERGDGRVRIDGACPVDRQPARVDGVSVDTPYRTSERSVHGLTIWLPTPWTRMG